MLIMIICSSTIIESATNILQCLFHKLQMTFGLFSHRSVSVIKFEDYRKHYDINCSPTGVIVFDLPLLLDDCENSR